MVVIDTLLHNHLHRTGTLRRFGASWREVSQLSQVSQADTGKIVLLPSDIKSRKGRLVEVWWG